VPKLQCNKHSAYAERLTTSFDEVEAIEIFVMDLKESEARNNCAVEVQQQFN
jgi:hypothetical protein